MRKLNFLKICGVLAGSITDVVWGMKYSCILGSTGMTTNTVGWGKIGKTFILTIPEDVEANVSKEALKNCVEADLVEVVSSLLQKIDWYPEISFFSEKNMAPFEKRIEKVKKRLIQDKNSKEETLNVLEQFLLTGMEFSSQEEDLIIKEEENGQEWIKRNQEREEALEWARDFFEDFILGSLHQFRTEENLSGKPIAYENEDGNLKMCIQKIQGHGYLSLLP